MGKLDRQLKKERKKEKELQQTMEEALYSRNFKKFGFDLNPFVSFTAAFLIFFLTVYAFVSNAGLFGLRPAYEVFDDATSFIVDNADWTFILATNFFIAFCVYLAASKLGNIRLGGLNAKPEFSRFSWYSMLISAGMGIGLMFWAVGEPLSHSVVAPPIYTGQSDNIGALAATFLHWGLHPWAIYAVMALALAYFAYNKKLPLSLRSIFYPIFKERVFGRIGDVIDLIAVLATLFGLATSLGLGVQQMNSGLNYLLPFIPFNVYIQVLLIIVITAIATISIISGIHKGVRFLSEMNIRIAGVFMALVLLIGPTAVILRTFATSLGVYFGDFIPASMFLSLGDTAARAWQGDWTIFYWAWWISWSPFVGMFVARVSRGRTIREFIVAVLFVPSMLSFLWLSVFGGAAFSVNENMGGGLFDIVSADLPVGMFEMFNNFDIGFMQGVVAIILSIVATVLVMFFFITSSDSGSIVVNAITSGGKTDTKSRQRVFWAAMEGLIAAVLILIGGEQALSALQNAVILTGLPFAILLFIMSIILLLSLQMTYNKQKHRYDVNRVRDIIEDEEIVQDVIEEENIQVKS